MFLFLFYRWSYWLSQSPLKNRKVMDVLPKLTMVIISQCVHVSVIMVYTLNIHSVTCQLWLNKAGGRSSGDGKENFFCLIEPICLWLLFMLYPLCQKVVIRIKLHVEHIWPHYMQSGCVLSSQKILADSDYDSHWPDELEVFWEDTWSRAIQWSRQEPAQGIIRRREQKM